MSDYRLGEVPNSQLRALKIGDHRERTTDLQLHVPDEPDALRMLLVRPMREVEARGVHPRLGEREHGLPRRRHGPERGDDLGAAWAHSRHGLSVSRDSNVTLP